MHPRLRSDLEAFGWSRDSSTVFYGEKPVSNADAAAFLVVGEFYGKDKNRVYYGGEEVLGTDAETFHAYDPKPIGPKPDAYDSKCQYKYGKVVESWHDYSVNERTRRCLV